MQSSRQSCGFLRRRRERFRLLSLPLIWRSAECSARSTPNATRCATLLCELVAIPTENPPATGYLPCVALLESALAELGLPFERIEIPSPAEAPRAAIRAWVGDEGPALVLPRPLRRRAGHVRRAVRAAIEGDTLFGRGSSDMKSGLVAMLFAAQRRCATAGVALRGRLELLLVPDEETGGAFGTGALAAAGLLADDAVGMLLPEPTSGVVWNANRGAMTLEVTVRGRAAHVGAAAPGHQRGRARAAAADAAVRPQARARGARRVDSARRRPRRRRVELQRRAGRMPLHDRSPDRSRRGLRRREAAAAPRSSTRRGRQRRSISRCATIQEGRSSVTADARSAQALSESVAR